MTLDTDLDIVADIAHEAGEIVLSYFDVGRMRARPKGDRDVVTAADLESEALISHRLQEAFPLDGLVGEEGSNVQPQGRRCWIVDPLDGTFNYSLGIPFWCVSLALFIEQKPVLGVVYDPIRRETFRAAQGSGASCDGVPIHTRRTFTLDRAVVHVTVDFAEDGMLASLDDVRRIAPAVMRTRNMGSAALALAYVAAGRFDAMVHRLAHSWDYGAGVVLVSEAGGQSTGIDGEPYAKDTATMLAAGTSDLHGALLGLLQDNAVRQVQQPEIRE